MVERQAELRVAHEPSSPRVRPARRQTPSSACHHIWPMRLSTNRAYTGRRIAVDLDTVRFPDGSTGTLEMVRHPGASAVIPFLDDPASPDPRVILIRQYRYAAEGELWEIPAGTLDRGEDPVACAHRELREEAGCVASTMRHLYHHLHHPRVHRRADLPLRCDRAGPRAPPPTKTTSSSRPTRSTGPTWAGCFARATSATARPSAP